MFHFTQEKGSFSERNLPEQLMLK